MKKAYIIFVFLAVCSAAIGQEVKEGQTRVVTKEQWQNTQRKQSLADTTLLQPRDYFDANTYNSKRQEIAYHFQKAGSNLTASVVVGILGGLLTGVIAYGATDEKALLWAVATGGVTCIACSALIASAGSHLKDVGQLIE